MSADGIWGALEGLKYGARSALSPRVLQGAAVELGWITTHLAMYRPAPSAST